MSLDTIMNLSITVESRAPSQAGFGTPLLFGYHLHNLGQLVKQYSAADDMLDDGFTTDDALYKAAQIVKSQNPSPDVFKIGRRVTALTQVVTLEPLSTTEGFKYKGTIGGKALLYTVLAGATSQTVSAALISAINALSAGTTASGDGSASVTGSVVGPWDFETTGKTLLVSVDADVPGSPDTATFTGVAAARECANAEVYALTDALDLTVKVDGGIEQTVVFHTANFVDITNATAEEVAAEIASQLLGALVSVTSTGTKVTITSDTKGTDSHIEVTGGTANSALGFNTAVVNGTGNVGSLAAVTFAEAKLVIEAATDATVTTTGGALTLSSGGLGTSSKVNVDAASTADVVFGFDNAEHTGADAGAVITCTANDAGEVVDFAFPTMSLAQLKIKDATEDTTTDDELPDVEAEDGEWYGLLIVDSSSKATTLHGAGWTEARRKLFVAQTCDSDVLDSIVEDDTMSSLKDSSYARTGCIYHRSLGGVEWLAAGWFAGALTTTPGAATMAFKSVAGVAVDRLQSSEESTILLKNGSHYTDTGGLPITFEGKSGSGDFMDTTRFIDWVYARMREAVLGALANAPKIPFTDGGVDVMRSLILGVIQQGQTAGGFSKEVEPVVSAPLVKNVSAANRINRILPDINWSAQLAGAIHRMNPVRGRVSV